MTRTGTDNSPKRYNRPTFQAAKLLLVEGPDEFHFFRFVRPRDDVQIHVYEGKDQLKLELQTIQNIEGFDQVRRIAIVRDADNDAFSATQSVLAQWAIAFNKPLPSISSDEWFEDDDGRSWSVWIMPEPNQAGDLEELLWQAVTPSDHRLCIEKLIDCLDECEPIPFASKTKARFYTWLSTQSKPLKDLYTVFGLGSSASLFDPSSNVFARFGSLIDNM